MASITPLVSTSNTEQSTASQTLVDSTESIAGASLANGVKHLVLYSVAYGGNDSSAEPEVVVLHGETVIGRGGDEAEAAYTTTMAMTGSTLSSPYVITGDGVNALKIQFRSRSSSDTAYIKGSTLIAIPLGDLVEGTDYFYAQQNGDTAEQSATDSDQIVLWDSFTLPDTGDYLVLGGLEGTISSGGANTEGWRMGLTIGTTQKEPMRREWEDSDASQSFSYGRVHALNSGSNTISVFGGTGQGTTAVKEYRRGRIFVFNLAATSFDKTANETSDGETEVTDSYPTYTDLLSHAYTPNQQEYVLVIGNVMGSATGFYNGPYPVMARLQNSTDAAEFGDFAANAPHDEDTDYAPLTIFACEQIAAVEKTYKLQVSGHDAAGDSAYFEYPDLIILSLTTGAATGLTAKTFTETAVRTDTKERGLVMARTHTEAAAHSHVIDAPSGPARYVNGSTGDDNWNGQSDTFDGSGVGPWATLQHAADTVATGTTVYVADGNYKGFEIANHVATGLDPTLFVARGSSVVIDEMSDAWNEPFVQITDSEYIIFQNINIDGSGLPAISGGPGHGFKIFDSTYIEFNGCRIEGVSHSGVATVSCNEIRTIDCTFIDCCRGGDNFHTIYYSGNDFGTNKNLVIQGCDFSGETSGANPLQINNTDDNSADDCIIDSNKFHDDVFQVNMFGCKNCIVTNNIWYNRTTSGYALRIFGEANTTGDKPNRRPASSGNIIANNTFVNNQGGCINFLGPNEGGTDPAHDNYVFNNIIIAGPGNNPISVSSIDGGPSASLGDQYISNNITGNYDTYGLGSLFTDYANDDYTILDGSAAHDAGIPAYLGKSAPTTDLAGVSRPQNGFFDIGCYEIYHGQSQYIANPSDNAKHTDTMERGIAGAREYSESAAHADTFDREGGVYGRTYTEGMVRDVTNWHISLPQTPEEHFLQLSDTARRSDAMDREGSTFGRTPTDTSVRDDTLERAVVYGREFTEAAVHTDTLDQTNVPPASSVIGVVGYVSDGIVGAETG